MDLNLEEITTYTKPGKNSRHFTHNEHEYSFKSCLPKPQVFTYRCVNRKCCNGLLHVPIQDNFDKNLEISTNTLKNTKLVTEHSNECQLNPRPKTNQDLIDIDPFQSDIRQLQMYVYDNPLQEPKVIQMEMYKKNQKFKLCEINKVIQ